VWVNEKLVDVPKYWPPKQKKKKVILKSDNRNTDRKSAFM